MKKLILNALMTGLLSLVVSANAEQVTFFYDNMENGTNGWTVNNFGVNGWHQSDVWSSSSDTSWHMPTTIPTGGAGNSNDGYITSPSITISSTVTNAQLQFNQLMVNDWEWPLDDDIAFVSISDDGGTTWQSVYYSFLEGNSTETIDLSQYIGDTIKIRFEVYIYPCCLECSDCSESTFASAWHLDDVRVTGNR
jgi:hypothetical protein